MGIIKCFGPAEAEMSLAALSCCCTTAASKSICGLTQTQTKMRTYPHFSIYVGIFFFTLNPPNNLLSLNSFVIVQTSTSKPCVIPQNSSFDLWGTAKKAPIC